MFTKVNRQESRQRKHERLRKKVMGTAERPRMAIYRSLKHFHVQIIDDVAGVTLLGVSTQDPQLKNDAKKTMANTAGAKLVGELVAKRALDKKIENVVFDRGGYIYHGVVKALADSARGAGLKF
ncbi:MAG TPA: 50S ribosomal protein L18 [bacterium]|jgi:large subunit ribosomal protein L18|nr:50S ribosomal protein L18 [bacterium]